MESVQFIAFYITHVLLIAATVFYLPTRVVCLSTEKDLNDEHQQRKRCHFDREIFLHQRSTFQKLYNR